jgi:hypothetical protein
MDFEIARALQVVLGHRPGDLRARARATTSRARPAACASRPSAWASGRASSARASGATDYQVALDPLGGFCRMAGRGAPLRGLPPEPDELPAKSVGQRFFIYSGGVLMNLLFGSSCSRSCSRSACRSRDP